MDSTTLVILEAAMRLTRAGAIGTATDLLALLELRARGHIAVIGLRCYLQWLRGEAAATHDLTACRQGGLDALADLHDARARARQTGHTRS